MCLERLAIIAGLFLYYFWNQVTFCHIDYRFFAILEQYIPCELPQAHGISMVKLFGVQNR